MRCLLYYQNDASLKKVAALLAVYVFFLLLRSRLGRPITKGIGEFLGIPGMIYLLGLVLAILGLCMKPRRGKS